MTTEGGGACGLLLAGGGVRQLLREHFYFIDNVACEAGVHKRERFTTRKRLAEDYCAPSAAEIAGGKYLRTVLLQYPCSVVRWYVCAFLSLPW